MKGPLFWRIYAFSVGAALLTFAIVLALPQRNLHVGLLVLLILLAFSLLIVIRPIEKRLKELEKTTEQLAHGNLNVRARISGYDSISHLAERFNYMADRIESLIRSQQELTNAISHELRTPIARICFELEMVAMATTHEEHDKQLKAIEQDLKELNDLIEELLVYARLGAGGPPMRFKETMMEPLIQNICEKFMELYPSITYQWNPSTEIPMMVVADSNYLQRAVQNLISNASRYAKSMVKITFSQEKNEWRLEVEDDGPGIPPEERERVFSPFARLDDSRTRATGGHGLGLAIVRRIVRWHQGKVWIEESVLGGAKLIFTWPQGLALKS